MEKPLIVQIERNILPLSADVHSMCSPILSSLGIHHFNYRRSYKNGDTCVLTNDPKWVQHYYLQGYGSKRTLEAHKKTITADYIFWNHWEEDSYMAKILADAKKNFNIDSGVTITINHPDFVDLFSFGADKQENLNEEAFKSKIALLYRFISYFYEKAHHLVLESRFHLSHTLTAPAVEHNHISDENIEAFLSRNADLQLIYDNGLTFTLFTKKESDCLYLMLRGYSSKMIAKRLNASVRTIETHFANIQRKLKHSNYTEKQQIAQKIKLINRKNNEIIDDNPIPFFKTTNSELEQYRDFIDNTKTKKIFTNFCKSHETYLTPREAQILHYLCFNLKISDISVKLNISIKTAYEYLNNIKQKTNLFSKSEIIHKAWSTNALQLIAGAQLD